MKSKELYIPMKEWHEDDQPREKLIEKGARELSNAELIAILLGSGSKEESALDLSKKMLKAYDNDLNKFSKLEIAELIRFKGVGPAKAVTLVASFELSARVQLEKPIDNKISCSSDAYNLLKPLVGSLQVEEFWILVLNRANKVVSRKKISQGGVAGTVVDIKIIAKVVVNELASGIILAHNHPSGNLKPSKEDIQITKKVKEALLLLDVSLLDHLIVTSNDFYSFADEGIL